jgi:hypothetical protein
MTSDVPAHQKIVETFFLAVEKRSLRTLFYQDLFCDLLWAPRCVVTASSASGTTMMDRAESSSSDTGTKLAAQARTSIHFLYQYQAFST